MADINPIVPEGIYVARLGTVRVKTLADDDRQSLMDKVLERAPDPSVFEEAEPFFFKVRASNDKLDSYFTRMDATSLKNYAADAISPGVQFLNSHKGFTSAGFGRSLDAQFVDGTEERAVYIDFYTQPGLSSAGMSSDELIRGMRSGIFNDVSIGFSPDTMICNVCGGDFLNREGLAWDDPARCWHWPGFRYEVKGKKEKVRCELDVVNARLNEVSAVYDGATPDAGVVVVDKARMASAAGVLKEDDRLRLEHLYQARIAPTARSWQGVTVSNNTTNTTNAAALSSEGTDGQTNETPQTQAATRTSVLRLEGEKPKDGDTDKMAALRTKYRDRLDLNGDVYEVLTVLADEVITQQDRIKALESLASDGEMAREAVLKDLDASVVRAFGATETTEAKQARYRAMMDGRTLDDIREQIADLEEMAKVRFPNGQQTTTVTDGDEDTGDDRGYVPATASRKTVI